MKHILLILLLLISINTVAQNNLKSADDISRISLTPVILSRSSIPSYASSLVKNKLVQAVTKNGLGSKGLDPRFIITANFVEVTRDNTPTAPPMIAITLLPTIYIGDAETGQLYSSCSLNQVKGVGTNETKAYLSAVKNLNLQGPDVHECIEKGKTRIIEYYNSQIDFIISKAQAFLDNEKYDDALMVLLSVPDVCKDAYLKAMDMTAVVYQQKIDKESLIMLNTANQIWNANQSYEGAERAAQYLSKIHPFSSSFKEASVLSETIAKRVKELDTREWNFKMKQYDDQQALINKKLDYGHEERMTSLDYSHSERQAMIQASKEVGLARAKQPVTYNYNYIRWW